MGDRATITMGMMDQGDIRLPTVDVAVDKPAIPTLAAQMAGWQLKTENYFAMGSGPARVLATKPKDIYESLGYSENAQYAVLALESEQLPDEGAVKKVSEKTRIPEENIALIVAPTNSIAGAIQIAARCVEIPVLRLFRLGLPPRSILAGWGRGPIAMMHPKSSKMMGRTNDMLLYAGTTVLCIAPNEDVDLLSLAKKAVSSSSKDYGKPFYQIFKSANWDFYAIDEGLFSIAELVINNVKTGETIRTGKINLEVIKESINYKEL